MAEQSQNPVSVPSAITTFGVLASAPASAARTRPLLPASTSAGSVTTTVGGPGTALALAKREPPDMHPPSLAVLPSAGSGTGNPASSRWLGRPVQDYRRHGRLSIVT